MSDVDMIQRVQRIIMCKLFRLHSEGVWDFVYNEKRMGLVCKYCGEEVFDV